MSARRALLYGRSLLLSLVADSLVACSGLNVDHAVTWDEARRSLDQGFPDVLIFDLTEPCESRIWPLLLNNPGLLLIGLDTERNKAVLVSGQEAQSLTLSGIQDIVGGR